MQRGPDRRIVHRQWAGVWWKTQGNQRRIMPKEPAEIKPNTVPLIFGRFLRGRLFERECRGDHDWGRQWWLGGKSTHKCSGVYRHTLMERCIKKPTTDPKAAAASDDCGGQLHLARGDPFRAELLRSESRGSHHRKGFS